MLQAKAAAIQPPQVGAPEMAQILAAVVEREDEVLALVESLAPTCAGILSAELGLLANGVLAHGEISVALRWILLEIHDEMGRRFPAVLA